MSEASPAASGEVTVASGLAGLPGVCTQRPRRAVPCGVSRALPQPAAAGQWASSLLPAASEQSGVDSRALSLLRNSSNGTMPARPGPLGGARSGAPRLQFGGCFGADRWLAFQWTPGVGCVEGREKVKKTQTAL